MSVRIGPTRIGHRVGDFYVSAPISGRNAGRQVRVGHRLPGGFYASVPMTTTTGRPSRPIGSYPAWLMVLATVATVAFFGWLAIASGAWWLWLSLAGGLAWQWLTWAANPQQRQPHQRSR